MPTTIAYGPGYNDTLAAVCGEAITFPPRVVASCNYLRPTWTAYQLTDGRVVVVVNQTMSDIVTILPDSSALRDWENSRYAIDPETSAPFGHQRQPREC